MRRVLALMLMLACARPLPPGAVQTVVDRARGGKRVIFVGLDGADWRLLEPFAADGTMPRLAEIVRRAETRVLMTQHPPLSPLVWTSMMTGVSPLEHRVLDFARFHPRTGALEPITSDERAVPAIWNMARYGGKRAGVFGLWATFPPEEGVILTDRDLPRDYVAATNLIHERASRWIRDEKPDLAIVYFQGTDEVGHFAAGRIEEVRDYFRRIDAILGEYRALADDLDAELVIASDHGFDWGGAHDESSTAAATAAKWHRSEGVWIRYPHDGRRVEPARVVQVCATLLEMLGLPRGEEIAESIGGAGEESVNYRRYFRRAEARPLGETASEGMRDDDAIAKLKALGYLSSTSSAPRNRTTTRTPQSFNNEGLILRQASRRDEAENAFRDALTIDPVYASARQNLDDLLSARGIERLRNRDCANALADLRAVERESALLWASIAAAEGCIGNDAAAETALRRSLELDPNQPELQKLLQ